jgi:hypothetical protein
MSERIEVGDRVRYVREGILPGWHEDWPKKAGLCLGAVYTVEAITPSGNIILSGPWTTRFDPGYFEKVPQTLLNFPQAQPNCRCSTAPAFEGDLEKGKIGYAIDCKTQPEEQAMTREIEIQLRNQVDTTAILDQVRAAVWSLPRPRKEKLTYTFTTGSAENVDLSKIAEDLSRERPLLDVWVGEERYILVHYSLVRLADRKGMLADALIGEDDSSGKLHGAHVFHMEDKGRIGSASNAVVRCANPRAVKFRDWIDWAKKVKNAPWPENSGGKVEVKVTGAEV